jgi:hypothetical protein
MSATPRRTPVEPEVEPAQSYAMGFGSDELALPRLRVVGKDSDMANAGIAKSGDIAIGDSKDDADATVFGPNDGVKFVVLDYRVNYACGFNGPKGSWEEGDPEMPAEAKKQYHYTLCVPGFDTILPVLYTAGGSAAKTLRAVNTKLAKHTTPAPHGKGQPPYTLGFAMTTKIFSAQINGQTKTWPGPVIGLAALTDEEIEVAKALYETVVGPGRKQLDAASSETPDF